MSPLFTKTSLAVGEAKIIKKHERKQKETSQWATAAL